MNFLHLFLVAGLALFAIATPLTVRKTATPPEKAGGRRRGISYNDPTFVRLFDVENNQMSWSYNWDSTTDNTKTAFEYVPMLWGNQDEHTSIWEDAYKNAAGVIKNSPTHLLGFNEPDMCEHGSGGSCMSPQEAANAWKKHMEPAKQIKDKMYLGSPAVTNGANGMGLDWLRDFMIACSDCNIDFICIHWHDDAKNTEYFKRHITDARKVSAGRPIWITELGPRGTDQEIKEFLNAVIPWLDSSSDVHRYSMFMAREGFLVNRQGNDLSEVGKHFVYWKSDGKGGHTTAAN